MFRLFSPAIASTASCPATRARRSFVPTCVGQSVLETRQVLSTSSLSALGTLTVNGTPGADQILVLQVGDKIAAPDRTYVASAVKFIFVQGFDGDDSINVVSPIKAWVDGGRGHNTYSGIKDPDTIVDTMLTGGLAMTKAVLDRYEALGGSTNPTLGVPTGNVSDDEVPVVGGRVSHFSGGSEIDYSQATGVHQVYGSIYQELEATAHETDAFGNSVRNILGLATSDESDGLGGRVSHFQGGDIDWSPRTGAHAVIGAIAAEYAATVNEVDAYGNNVQRILGQPTGDETNVPGIAGARMQAFQGGTIYWSLSTGAHALYGAINAYGGKGPVSVLGLPISDEQGLTSFRTVHFQHGVIAWSATTGARILGQ